MLAPTQEQRLAWMAQWRSAAVALERVCLEELDRADLARIAADLEDASITAGQARRLVTSSGLIAQQQILHRRLRR